MMDSGVVGRALRSWLCLAAALTSLPSCAEEATATAGDATVLDATDLGTSDSVVDDLRDVVSPTDVPIADVGVDVNNGLSIPIDPMGVPAPGSECPGVHPGDPTIAPPRPIVPQSVSRVTSMRPTFRWALPAGTTGARVEVCADRCCTRVIQTLEAEGTSVRPTAALPPGVVYWRMFGRRAGVTGSRASYTWEFGVRRRDTPVDSSWGTIRDFTGDGYDDMVLVAALNASDRFPTQMYVVEGGPSGPSAPREVGVVALQGSRSARVGDFNGDGSADMAIEEPAGRRENRLTIVEGGTVGVHVSRVLDISAQPMASYGRATVADWNGDGYSDLVVSVYFRSAFGILGSVLVVYHGSPSGLGDRPQFLAALSAPIRQGLVYTVSDFGDNDLDGYGDVYLNDRISDRSTIGDYIVGNQSGGGVGVREVTRPPTGLGTERFEGPIDSVPAGDLDGDGFGDFALYPLFSYRLFVYMAARGLAEPAYSLPRSNGVLGVLGNAGFGVNVEAADLNGDGFSDLLVSASGAYAETWTTPDFPYNSGRLYVYFGSSGGIAENPIWFDRARPSDPSDNPQAFASRIASPGDLDADGIDDVAIVDGSRGQICYVRGSAFLNNSPVGGCGRHPGFDVSVR